MFRVYGDPSKNNHGVPVPWGKNPLNGLEVFLHIRRMPPTVAQDFEKRYGKETTVKEGGRLYAAYERTHEEFYSLLYDKAEWMWCEATNFVVTIEDEKAAAFFRDALKDEALVVGHTFPLDGKLGNRIRRFFLTTVDGLALRIITSSEELDKAEKQKEEDLRKNS
jgi:hypothetical protein